MPYNVKINIYDDTIQVSLYDYLVGKYDVDFNDVSVVKESSYNDFEECSTFDEQPFNDGKSIPSFDNEADSLVKNDFISNSDVDVLRSLRRTKQTIYDYARSNKWEWFSTFTFAKNRYDYDLCLNCLSQFLRDFKRRRLPSLQWLIVPEQHKDGAWHFHGLFIGDLKPFLVSCFEVGRYQLLSFKYGLTQFERVKDSKRVASYICKYITKDMHSLLKGRRKYLCNKGLRRSNILTLHCPSSNKIDFVLDAFPDYDIVHFNNSFFNGQMIQYLQLKKRGF